MPSDLLNFCILPFCNPEHLIVRQLFVHVADEAVRDAPLLLRAATVIKAMLPFRTLVEACVNLFFFDAAACTDALPSRCSALLEPDKVCRVPLCMDSHKWLYVLVPVSMLVDIPPSKKTLLTQIRSCNT